MVTKISQENINNKDLKVEELYSFDVFDTLITRTTATPKGIFAIMQSELCNNPEYKNYPESLKKNFYYLRIDAEKISRYIQRSKIKVNEITIDDIYNQLGKGFFLSEEEKETLKSLELKTEIKNFIPISENIKKLSDLYYKNKKVILISDMYLQANIIRDFLRPFIPFINEIEIFSSCETLCGKGNGSAFEFVHNKLGIATKNWYHVGDNEKSDFAQAKKYGINAELYKYPKLQSYEKTILSEYENDLEYQKLIGLCRNIRLLNDVKDLKTKTGICLTGPILISYVLLILENSLKQGINRLYFIARDGFVLKEIADILIEKNNYPIKTKYIYGSRIAWRVPSMISADINSIEETLNYILYDYESLAKSLGITQDELGKFIDKKYRNKKFNLSEQEHIKNILMNNKNFLDFIIERNMLKRSLIKEYLIQEIDFSDDRFAFVDLCGSGNANNCLSNIINDFYNGKINIFYMATHKPVNTTEKVERALYKYCDKPLMWIEIISRTTQGQTLGYRKDSSTGEIKPVFEEYSEKFWEKWKYNNYLNGVKLFAKYSDSPIPFNILDKYASLLYSTDKTIVETFGDVPFSVIGIENAEFAPQISKTEALLYLMFNIYPKTNSIHWSKIRSSECVQKIINFKRKYGSIRKFIFDLNFSTKPFKISVFIWGHQLI